MRFALLLHLLGPLVTVSLLAQPAPPPAQAPRLYTPFDALQASFADAATIPPVRAKFARYLDMRFAQSEKDRAALYQEICHALNHLNRHKDLYRPPVVNGIVVRVMLDELGIDPKDWDKLIVEGSGPAAERTPEPYFYDRHKKLADVVAAATPKARGVPHSANKHDHATLVLTVEPADATIFLGENRTTQTGRNREISVGPMAQGKRYQWQLKATWPDGRAREIDLDFAGGETVVAEVAPAPEKKKDDKAICAREVLVKEDGGVAFPGLQKLTCTEYPIARADWFLYYSLLAPAYYDLLGLGDAKTKKDFEKFAFADLDKAKQAKSATRSVVKRSTVAAHIRTLNRVPTFTLELGGWWWESEDYDNSLKGNGFVNIIKRGKPVAYEVIFSLASGYQAYALFDGEEKRLDVAVIGVARDRETKFTNPEVWCAWNCISCHAQGMRNIDCEVRALSQEDVALLTPDPVEQKKLREQYGSDLNVLLGHDRAIFSAAVLAATGLKPEVIAPQLELRRHRYFEGPVGLAEMAAEFGETPEAVRAVIFEANTVKGLAENGFNPDPILTGVLKAKPRYSRRDEWEEIGYPQLAFLLAKKKLRLPAATP